MKNYSDNKDLISKKLHYNQIEGLLNIICETSMPSLEYIRKKYEEYYRNFNISLLFLEEIRLIKKNAGNISITPTIKIELLQKIKSHELDEFVIRRIFKYRTQYKKEIKKYLKLFNLDNDKCIQKLDKSRNIWSRNFLMELGAIRFNHEKEVYVLEEKYIDLYVKSKQKHFVTRKKFDNAKEKQDEIGLIAEKEIIKYEKQVIGERLSNKIEHVSLNNLAAGYDILSLREINRWKIEQRFIEVKAVSPLNHRFFWTKNEVEVAKLLKNRYFLYLLPFCKLKPIIQDLLIIKNPFLKIIIEGDRWEITKNVIECKKKTTGFEKNEP